MRNKIKWEKNTPKRVYKLKYLNIEKIEALHIREQDKKQDKLCKKIKQKLENLFLLLKQKKKFAQKMILKLENTKKTTLKLNIEEK